METELVYQHWTQLNKEKYEEFTEIYPGRGWYARAQVHIEAAGLMRTIMKAVIYNYGLVLWNGRPSTPYRPENQK